MNNWLETLQYGKEYGNQQFNLEIAHAFKDEEGNAKFSKWKSYIECDEEFKSKANNRTILPNEVVVDLEEPERYEEVIQAIKKDFLYYQSYKTGSKGYHIHLWFDKALSSEEKKEIIRRYGADEQKATQRCMIALENVPHWKTGNPKNLVEAKEGFNKLEVKVVPTFEQVYDDTVNMIHYYMDVNNDTASILALWCLGTHFYEQFTTFPILFLNAGRGSGKTRCLGLLSHLCAGFSGKTQNNISLSSVFRTKGVLLFDEAEKLQRSEYLELLTLLNGCYKKGSEVTRQKKVKGKEGENFEDDKFNLYRPVAVANINGLDKVLQDRALIVYLDKTFDKVISSKVEDFDYRLKSLKEKIRLLVSDSVNNIDNCDNLMTQWNDYLESKNKMSTVTTCTAVSTKGHTILDTKVDLFNRLWVANIVSRSLEITLPLILMSRKINDAVFEDTLKLCSSIANNRSENEKDDLDTLIMRFVSSKSSDIEQWHTVNTLYNEFSIFAQSSLTRELSVISFGMALDRLKLIDQRRRTNKDRLVKLDIKHAAKRVGLFDSDTQNIEVSSYISPRVDTVVQPVHLDTIKEPAIETRQVIDGIEMVGAI